MATEKQSASRSVPSVAIMGTKYLAAYLMAVLAGKASPSESDVKQILEAGGVDIDAKSLKLLMEKVEGKTANELIAEGSKKFAAAGGGGSGGGPTTTAEPTRNPQDAVQLVAPSVGDGDPTNNPVVELFMYRAQEFDGETPYAMENVNMADLPGVIQYIHREIIAEHTIGAVDRRTGEARAARKYDISAILRYRFLVKNPDTLSGTSMDFNGYVTFDFGQASNRQQWSAFPFRCHYNSLPGESPDTQWNLCIQSGV